MRRRILLRSRRTACTPPPSARSSHRPEAGRRCGKSRSAPPARLLPPEQAAKIPAEWALPVWRPIATAGGVVFIGAALDRWLTPSTSEGRELWRGPLPESGKATPMTYRLASGAIGRDPVGGGRGERGLRGGVPAQGLNDRAPIAFASRVARPHASPGTDAARSARAPSRRGARRAPRRPRGRTPDPRHRRHDRLASATSVGGGAMALLAAEFPLHAVIPLRGAFRTACLSWTPRKQDGPLAPCHALADERLHHHVPRT